MHKLGVIVPYRNRYKQLRTFLKTVPQYLQKQNVDHEIIVVEQMDEEGFNRGALLNAGFLKAKELGCDYVAFHDVDLLPRYVDYSYTHVPLELVGKVLSSKVEEGFQIPIETFTDDYFGGVVLFPVDLFEKINGYSNKYIGWGFEDNDLLLRCWEAQIPLRAQKYRQYEALEPALTFNGESSFVRIPLPEKLLSKKSCSFLVNFRVDDLPLNKNLASDECAIFCIPGLDAALCYESFGTYKFEIFDNYEDVYSLHSKKLPTRLTMQAVITLDVKNRVGRMYLNGKEIGHFEWPRDRELKLGSNEIYLGVGHPTRVIKAGVSRKWFRGQISDFAIFERTLDRQEIFRMYSEGHLGLGKFDPIRWYSGKVVLEDNMVLPNLMPLSRNQRDKDCIGEAVDCTVEPLVSIGTTYQIQAGWKRPGTFVSQPHETDGTEEGYWKSWATRVNQARYRDAETNGTLKVRDGLKNLNDVLRVKQKYVSFPGVTHLQVRFK